MIRNVSVRITGLPEADNHVDAFKKEVEDACFADNLKEYTPFANLANNEVAVTMKIKAIIDFTSEGAAPERLSGRRHQEVYGPNRLLWL
jgi:hypothetical protein